MVSYEVAMGLAVVSVILMTSLNEASTGTLSMIGIVQAQQAQQQWFVFKFFPLGLIGFFIFAVAMVAETNRAPFDLPEAESELTAGFHTEYSGFRWSLFFLAEYSAMIAVSSIAVTLWLGGWLRPFPNALQGPTWDLVFSLIPGLTFLFLAAMTFYSTVRMPKHPLFRVQTIGLAGFGALLGLIGLVLFVPGVRVRVQDIFWFSAKVACFMYLYIWYRGTFPRYRFDQLIFVAGVQIILYAGGIMVLFLFVIMLISIERTEKERQFNKQWLVGIAAAAALGGLFIAVYTTTTSGRTLFPEGKLTFAEGDNTQRIAGLLFDRATGTYMFAFEIASLLLLVAIIGAVVMAKKRI